ncbi:MAG: hypothetical protein GC182_21785 [Rhodopseudomonas sp.]|nr:hypothetical protein [Rhodopseudomonas sp.]
MSSLGAPKPAYESNDDASADAAGTVDGTPPGVAGDMDAVGTAAVVGFDHWLPKQDVAAPTARLAEGLVTVRPKPEKRQNAKARAKAALAAKAGSDQPALLPADAPASQALAGPAPAADATEAVTGEPGDLAMAHPKPEKRKNARARALEKLAGGRTAADGTTPDMTATAKSELSPSAGAGFSEEARIEDRGATDVAAPAEVEAGEVEIEARIGSDTENKTKAEAKIEADADVEAPVTPASSAPSKTRGTAKSVAKAAKTVKADARKAETKKADAKKAVVTKVSDKKASARKAAAQKPGTEKAPAKKARTK